MKLEFEWDKAKAKANFRRHGVSFDLAKTVFKDPFAIERLDDREQYDEERFVIIGVAEGKDRVVCSLYRTPGSNTR
jgi:uncharacterized protein